MANTYIAVDTSVSTATLARRLLAYKEAVRNAYELGTELKAIFDHLKDASDFSAIETKCGLAAGKGTLVYDLVNGSVGAMNNAFQNDDCKQITEQVGE